MKPLVSICIPTYNGAAYLGPCLDSALSQTTSDLEVLIVDDCSSDNSLDIAQRYARKDSRVRVSSNKVNLGLVENWNRCAHLAQGEWVKFLFQDDLVVPDCLGRLLAAADEFKVPIVSCARDFLFERGTAEDQRTMYLDHKTHIENLYRDSPHWSAEQSSAGALRWIGHNLFGEPTAVLLHRSVFARFGFFNPHLRSTCDLEYWVRVASNTGTAHIPDSLATFRVHPGAMSAHYLQTPLGRYRIQILDPLLIVHDYAFHPLYSRLRATATQLRPTIDLEDVFWKRALSALWFARRGSFYRTDWDASLLEEWHNISQHYPRLASIPFRERALAKWRALKKTVLLHIGRGKTAIQ
jgi:glycosyltransferase involved in cell wall biosynthesis